MFLRDLLSIKSNTVSFEVFPPKEISNLSNIEEIAALKPDFISVTCTAGGGNSKDTLKVADIIQNKYNITVAVHLTCVSAKKTTVLNFIDDIAKLNIENVLALRGDLKEGETPTTGDFKYASDLISFLKQHSDLSIGAASYPETHFEASSPEQDILNLSTKVSNGADFLITQLFFENSKVIEFRDMLTKYNIDKPLLLGLFPPVNYNSFYHICKIAKPELPKSLIYMVEKYSDNAQDLQKAGIEYTINQANILKQNGFTRFHIYTMNRSSVAYEILKHIKE